MEQRHPAGSRHPAQETTGEPTGDVQGRYGGGVKQIMIYSIIVIATNNIVLVKPSNGRVRPYT